jgi:putative transposase
MPRESRVIALGVPHHITQRGNARQDVFLTDGLRRAYLRLLTEHAAAKSLRVLGYCLMTNHVHVVAIPETEGSMANTFRHAHGRFSQYWNTERSRSGHLWQNRYYSCPVEEARVGRVIAYVESNPVRAGMVRCAGEFEWSSARSHLGMEEAGPVLDMDWWGRRWTAETWLEFLTEYALTVEEARSIREATYTGRPLGSGAFVAGLEASLGRKLAPGSGGVARRNGRISGSAAVWDEGL